MDNGFFSVPFRFIDEGLFNCKICHQNLKCSIGRFNCKSSKYDLCQGCYTIFVNPLRIRESEITKKKETKEQKHELSPSTDIYLESNSYKCDSCRNTNPC